MGVSIVKKEQALGKVMINGELESTDVVEEFITSKPMANVGMKVGHTKNLGNFESVRVDVTLYMPSDTDKESLDKTFKKVYKWCSKKLEKVVEDL